MFLSYTIFVLAIVFLIYYFIIRRSHTLKAKIDSLLQIPVLSGIQLILIAISIYIFKTAEGIDGIIVVYTLVPAIIIGLIILFIGVQKIKSKIKLTGISWISIALNAIAVLGFVFILILNSILYQ